MMSELMRQRVRYLVERSRGDAASKKFVLVVAAVVLVAALVASHLL